MYWDAFLGKEVANRILSLANVMLGKVTEMHYSDDPLLSSS